MIRFKYNEIAEWLKKNIDSGTYQNGDRLPAENELAERFSVSRDTVRKAIHILEKESLIIKVKGSGSYVNASLTPNPMTFHNNSRQIGILMTNVNNYIFPSIVHGINKTLNYYNYTPAVYFSEDNISQERTILTHFLNNNYAGLIIEPTRSALPPSNYDLYQEICAKVPTIIIHAKFPMLKTPAITAGDENAGFKLTKYLLDNGHRDIAAFFVFDQQTGTSRYLGFTKAFHNAGLTVNEENIFWLPCDKVNSSFEYPLTEDEKERIFKCSAIICFNDIIALGIKRYLKNNNVEKDIMICGFDNSSISQEHNFTSVTHPQQKFGEFVAMRLLDYIKSPDQDVSFDFNPSLVIR